ncbi:helix-turn-helix transcriptional regulator [Phytohabitans maris]|uniref:helix-turn-helix transcriptional regulator n=1 Tax=Phytohabitans maris TaxID=3071409 RepID=UPI003D185388
MSGSVGERIAAYRRRRGLSQAALAGLVGRSELWLSQVERGIRSVDPALGTAGYGEGAAGRGRGVDRCAVAVRAQRRHGRWRAG